MEAAEVRSGEGNDQNVRLRHALRRIRYLLVDSVYTCEMKV